MDRKLQAILFDCDGVLAETERDGHRVAYNAAFRKMSIDACWDPDLYKKLVMISGGKERMRTYFSSLPEKFPQDQYNSHLIQLLYERKTRIYQKICYNGLLPTRPGIVRLIQEAHQASVGLFVCSTSHKDSVEALLCANAGAESLSWLTDLFCGDIVPRKKPAPDIYNAAIQKHHLDPSSCVVIEDSRNGLLAAKGAGISCIVTPSFYTIGEDFSEADAVISSLGDPGGPKTELIRGGKLRITHSYVSLEDLRTVL